MTAKQIDLIQRSFREVSTMKTAAAMVFYDRLFTIDHGLRPLFSGNMEKQERAFMSMMEMIVGGLRKLDEVAPTLQTLGERHIGYRVRPEHFEVFEDALFWMLGLVLGSGFTSETETAWKEVYALVSKAMIESPSSS